MSLIAFFLTSFEVLISAGVTHGSASLMKHVTAGTLQSFTKMASSVARNLDYLTLDEEHVRRAEEQRRQRPAGVTEGLMQVNCFKIFRFFVRRVANLRLFTLNF